MMKDREKMKTTMIVRGESHCYTMREAVESEAFMCIQGSEFVVCM